MAIATLSKGVALVLIFGVALYAILGYLLMPMGSLVHPDMSAGFIEYAQAVYVHAFSAAVAMALGPLQFSDRIRNRRPAIHRWTGRTYLLVGVLVGGASGLYIAQHAFGGPVSVLGFSLLALLWLYTGMRAYISIRKRNYTEHQNWMTRNYALTLAAVTLRLYIPLSVVAGMDFAIAYPAIAWLCWAPNLAVAEWRYVRGN